MTFISINANGSIVCVRFISVFINHTHTHKSREKNIQSLFIMQTNFISAKNQIENAGVGKREFFLSINLFEK